MNNVFFPVKLLSITAALYPYREEFREANYSLNIPNDGKDRYVLCSPTVNRITKPEGAPYSTRMRLALLHESPNLDAGHYRLERYVDGELTISLKLTEINSDLASAIEAEIYNFLLRKKGLYINLM